MNRTNTRDCTHEWAHDAAHPDRYTCPNCDATTTGCQDCKRPLNTALTICPDCLTAAKRILTDIRDYLSEISIDAREILGLKAIRYNATSSCSTLDDSRLPFGLDTQEDNINTSGPGAIRTPRGALTLLEQWVDDWANLSGDNAGAHDTLTYLETHTLWAAQNHPAWTDYLTEARATRAVVRRLAGLEPEREPVPCIHCGGQIIHDWTPNGLDDVARCTGCGLTWGNRTHLDFANLAHLIALPTEFPDLLVTMAEAKRIYKGRVRPNLFDLWAHRAVLPSQRWNGEVMYRLADIDARCQSVLAEAAQGASC